MLAAQRGHEVCPYAPLTSPVRYPEARSDEGLRRRSEGSGEATKGLACSPNVTFC